MHSRTYFRAHIAACILCGIASLTSTTGRLLAAGPEIKRGTISRVQPQYPELARKMHIDGNVLIDVTIEANGNVTVIGVKAGHALLRTAAQNAVEKWKFTPAPLPTPYTITITFDLGQQ